MDIFVGLNACVLERNIITMCTYLALQPFSERGEAPNINRLLHMQDESYKLHSIYHLHDSSMTFNPLQQQTSMYQHGVAEYAWLVVKALSFKALRICMVAIKVVTQ